LVSISAFGEYAWSLTYLSLKKGKNVYYIAVSRKPEKIVSFC